MAVADLKKDQKETKAPDPVIRQQGEHGKQIWPEREPGDAQQISPLGRLCLRDAASRC